MQPGREESFSPALFLIWFVSSSLPFEFSSSRAYFCLRRAKTFCFIIEKSPTFPPQSKCNLSPQARSHLTPLETLPEFWRVCWSLLITQLISALLKQKHRFLGFVLCRPLGRMLSQCRVAWNCFLLFNYIEFFALFWARRFTRR